LWQHSIKIDDHLQQNPAYRPTKIFKGAFNAAGFQAVWWISVAGAIYSRPYLGAIALAVYLLIHFRISSPRHSELKLLFAAAFLGLLVDGIKSGSGFLSYSAAFPALPYLAPLWIVTMWVGFSATINHSLAWLRNRYLLAALMGAVFGPLSYLAGQNLGVMQFNYPLLPSLAVIGFVWGVSVPLLYIISDTMMAYDEAS
jgi:hypothetical protein